MEGTLDISWLTPLVFTILLYLTSLVVYRLLLHPLAKFPGPKLAAVTRYYEAYYDLVQSGQYTFKIAELHKQYGPIIRISPFELHVNDPRFYEKLYRQDGHWNKYDWSYDAFGAPLSAICSTDHDLHKRRRAPLNAYFSKANVASRQGLILDKVKKLRERMNDYSISGSELNLGAALSATSTDVATEYILGESYDNLNRTDFNQDLMNMLQASGGMWRATKHIRFLGPMMKAMPLSVLERSGGSDVKAFVAFLKTSKMQTQRVMAELTSNTAQESLPRTIIHDILRSDYLPPTEKEFDRVSDEVGTVAGAGIETVAQTLRSTIYHLYSNPTLLHRLRTELRDLSNSLNPEAQGEPALAQLESLPYLTAVIMEGLRLSPGLATRLARIAPDRQLVYDDKWVVPAGTPVSMTTLLMHWDEGLYPNARKFEPERWTDKERIRKAEKTFAPFSRGTRICLGMHLAWAELYLTLAMLVSHFDFDFIGTSAGDVDPDSDQFIIGTKSKGRMIVRVTLCRD
ncbi:hypothetical protein N7G274_003801 [Stereocaulon virgatum]|uniref:Cytochrome P450 n=1 Tax=Stereocaulon virgatum TaxID=373712 RepID=A0ABR4ADD7_9LECA